MTDRSRDFTRAEDYASAAEGLNAPGSWLGSFRGQAVQALRHRGFPGHDEAWKYTRVGHLLGEAFSPVVGSPPAVEVPDGPWGAAPRLVFVDGILDSSRSTAAGSLATAPEAIRAVLGSTMGPAEGFDALNLAFVRDGAGVQLHGDAELHLVHVGTGAKRLSAVRHVVIADEGARLCLYEHFVTVGEGSGLTSATTEVFVAPGAQVDHVRVLDEGADALHMGVAAAEVRGEYRFSSVVLGCRVARIEARVRLVAEGAHAELAGLSLLRGAQHVDHHVTADHVSPRGTSDQTFRAVLDDRSRSVYTGAVIVREGAVGTDSNQLHNALLLSDDAVANARPWLEIDNDDVSCAHGVAIGSLDADALFYLRQRGLSEIGARGLLTWGFASETLAKLPDGPVRAALHDRARRWLREAH